MTKDMALECIINIAFNDKVTKADYARFKKHIKVLGLTLEEAKESAYALGFALMWKKEVMKPTPISFDETPI